MGAGARAGVGARVGADGKKTRSRSKTDQLRHTAL